MEAKTIRNIDSKGRVIVPLDLLKFLQIESLMEVAICYWEGNGIMIRNLNNIDDCKIVRIVQLDEHRRLPIPKEIVGNTKKVEVYVKNDGSLILEEAQ